MTQLFRLRGSKVVKFDVGERLVLQDASGTPATFEVKEVLGTERRLLMKTHDDVEELESLVDDFNERRDSHSPGQYLLLKLRR